MRDGVGGHQNFKPRKPLDEVAVNILPPHTAAICLGDVLPDVTED